MELDPLSDSIHLQVILEDPYKKPRLSQLSTMLIHWLTPQFRGETWNGKLKAITKQQQISRLTLVYT